VDPSAGLIETEREMVLRACLKKLEQHNESGATLLRRMLAGDRYDRLLPELGLDPRSAYKLKHTALKILQECVGRSIR
jgi:hypothetical protein